MTDPEFTNTQKLACTEREIALRKRVYPNRIETGRMCKDKAEYELRIMKSIADDYRKLVQRERLL